MHRLFLLAVVATALIGCEDKQVPPPKPAATTPAPPPPSGAQLLSGVPGEPAKVAVAGLLFPIPAGWIQVPPGNTMRLAELQVPDPDPARVCTVAFSTAGGDVASNINRWAGQVRDEAGQPAKADVETRTVAGMNVTIAAMTGSYVGMGEAPKANWTLRGAIVETPDGLLFIKMTGPAEPMAANAGAFNSMVDGMAKP